MKTHRVNELIELLHPVWLEHTELNLVEMLQKLASEAGFEGQLSELTDDMLIYHLKCGKTDGQIPGIKKDFEDDFKTALLRARGILKD